MITAVSDPHQELLGFAKVTRDLTERRNLEQEERKAAELAGMEQARVRRDACGCATSSSRSRRTSCARR